MILFLSFCRTFQIHTVCATVFFFFYCLVVKGQTDSHGVKCDLIRQQLSPVTAAVLLICPTDRPRQGHRPADGLSAAAKDS